MSLITEQITKQDKLSGTYIAKIHKRTKSAKRLRRCVSHVHVNEVSVKCQIKVNSFQQSVFKWHYAFQSDLKREVFMNPLTSLIMTDMARIVFLNDSPILHPFCYTAQPLWWSNGSSFSFILAQDVTKKILSHSLPLKRRLRNDIKSSLSLWVLQ